MRYITAEQFSEMNFDGIPCELVRGTLQFREHPLPAHGYTVSQIIHAIMSYLETHPIGVVLGETGCTTQRGPDTVRAPDVSFISRDRLPPERRRGYPETAPDLAVEVLSESNSAKEMEQKVSEYFANGARLVWIADPQRRTVAVHAPEARPYVLGRDEILDGGDVLPGFRAQVNKFFGWLSPA